MSQNNLPATLKGIEETIPLLVPLYTAATTQSNPLLQVQATPQGSQLPLSGHMNPTLYPTISIEQPVSPLLSTASILPPVSPPTPLPPTNSVVDHIKPLWDPIFSQSRNRSRRPPWKDVVASAMKSGNETNSRTDILEKIREQQPWIINKSYDPECDKCCQNPAHAEAHVLINISYVFASCPGFTKFRGERWVFTGEPIALKRRTGKNAKQKDPSPIGGRKRGRPPKVPRETEIESAKKEADVKAKVASTRKGKAKAKIVLPPLDTGNSDPDNKPQANDTMALPQPEESTEAVFSTHRGNIGMIAGPHFGPDSSVEYPGHFNPGNMNSWMLGSYPGIAPLVEQPWAFQPVPPIDSMSQHSSYPKPDPALDYLWAHQPGNLIGGSGPSVDYLKGYQASNFVGQMAPPQLGPQSLVGCSRSPWQGLPSHNGFPFASPSGNQSLQSTWEAGQPQTVANPSLASYLDLFNL